MSDKNAEVVEEHNENEEDSLLQYLTFSLEDKILGVNLKSIQEVMGVKTISRLPRTPEFVRGVINLRGKVVPVIDLKLKFGMEETIFNIDSCIIIIEKTINDEPVLIGALADSVKDVIEVTDENIDDAPKMGGAIESKFITNLYRHEDTFFTMLNIDELFSKNELMKGADSSRVSALIE